MTRPPPIFFTYSERWHQGAVSDKSKGLIASKLRFIRLDKACSMDLLTKWQQRTETETRRQSCGEVEVRFVFLLDEAKRILGDRFPRGFQDNLFSFLYGESAGSDYSASMVFAGGQHLYIFSEDDTSPIGTRAESHFAVNLPVLAIEELLARVFLESIVSEVKNLAVSIMARTGGQAGLVARFVEEMSSSDRSKSFSQILDVTEKRVMENNRGLFENWTRSLTGECHAVAEELARRDTMSVGDIAAVLHARGLQRFLAHRTRDELQYMGIAAASGGLLYPVKGMFWDYWKELDVVPAVESSESAVWKVIEETELQLRQLVSKKFSKAYGLRSEAAMAEILGEKAWADIQTTKQKSASKYQLARNREERDVLSCMYFGHLKSLMISSKTWHLFKHMFRDKRELEDRINSIMPVRNDRAHFSRVPAKEMDRCRIACDDLVVMAEKDLAAMEGEETPPSQGFSMAAP